MENNTLCYHDKTTKQIVACIADNYPALSVMPDDSIVSIHDHILAECNRKKKELIEIKDEDYMRDCVFTMIMSTLSNFVESFIKVEKNDN